MGKLKQALIKEVSDLADCKKGTEVVLFFDNEDDEYHGFFQELNDNEIILKSLESDETIGLPYSRLFSYWERIK